MSFPSLNYNFLYTFFLEGYRWVMDFKATASRGVLIAQFEEYFDDALTVTAAQRRRRVGSLLGRGGPG